MKAEIPRGVSEVWQGRDLKSNDFGSVAKTRAGGKSAKEGVVAENGKVFAVGLGNEHALKRVLVGPGEPKRKRDSPGRV